MRDGDRPWSKPELAALDATLARLDKLERRALRQVSFVRQRGGRRQREAGLYEKTAQGGQRILVFDRAFERANRSCNHAIAHEVGHAIAAQLLLRHEGLMQKSLDRYNSAVRRSNDLVAAYNRLVRRANRGDAGAASELDGQRRALQRSQADLKDLLAEARAERRSYRRVSRDYGRRRPRLGFYPAYRRAMAGRRGPTPYGRTSLHESFAESFALYRCDRAPLQADFPGVVRWFASGGHLELLR